MGDRDVEHHGPPRDRDVEALVERIARLEEALRRLLDATDQLSHVEARPKTLAELARSRLRARELLEDPD